MEIVQISTLDKAIYDELVVAAQKLAVAVDNAGEVISEEFAGMVRDPLREVETVLEKCPKPETSWDGSLREEDLEIEYFEPVNAPTERADRNRGVRMRHKITGIGREAYTKDSQVANEEIARNALAEAVKKKFDTGS